MLFSFVGGPGHFNPLIAIARAAQIAGHGVAVTGRPSIARPELLADPLQKLRAVHRLPPDPDLVMLHRYLMLSPVPPGFRDPRFPLPATGHPLRPFGLDLVEEDAVPPWVEGLGDGPTAYFTLGPEFNLESGDLLARVIAALGALPGPAPAVSMLERLATARQPFVFGGHPMDERGPVDRTIGPDHYAE